MTLAVIVAVWSPSTNESLTPVIVNCAEDGKRRPAQHHAPGAVTQNTLQDNARDPLVRQQLAKPRVHVEDLLFLVRKNVVSEFKPNEALHWGGTLDLVNAEPKFTKIMTNHVELLVDNLFVRADHPEVVDVSTPSRVRRFLKTDQASGRR